MGLFDRIKEFTKPLRSIFKTQTAVNNNAVAKLEAVQTVAANIEEVKKDIKTAVANHASKQVEFQQRKAELQQRQKQLQSAKMASAQKQQQKKSFEVNKAVLAFASISTNPAAQEQMYNNIFPKVPDHPVEKKGRGK